MTDVRLVYVTARDSAEARVIANALLDAQLIACANIFPQMESIYKWQGEIRSENEAVLILKTEARLVPDVIKRVEAHHSYDTPCALAIKVDEGAAPYLGWLKGELTR